MSCSNNNVYVHINCIWSRNYSGNLPERTDSLTSLASNLEAQNIEMDSSVRRFSSLTPRHTTPLVRPPTQRPSRRKNAWEPISTWGELQIPTVWKSMAQSRDFIPKNCSWYQPQLTVGLRAPEVKGGVPTQIEAFAQPFVAKSHGRKRKKSVSICAIPKERRQSCSLETRPREWASTRC